MKHLTDIFSVAHLGFLLITSYLIFLSSAILAPHVGSCLSTRLNGSNFSFTPEPIFGFHLLLI